MTRPILAILSVATIVIAVVNFIGFVAETGRLGGDALSGYERDGHFYVSSHGDAKEVDEHTWRRNRIHAISMFATHPLGMLAMGYLLVQHIFPAFIFRGTREARAESERAVRASGTPWATFRCGGRIGILNIGGPLLRVSVHPGGLWIKPILMPPFAIAAFELVEVKLAEKWLVRGIEVGHSSLCVVTPIILAPIKDSATMAALHRLAGAKGSIS
jgi:hypothetical protein